MWCVGMIYGIFVVWCNVLVWLTGMVCWCSVGWFAMVTYVVHMFSWYLQIIKLWVLYYVHHCPADSKLSFNILFIPFSPFSLQVSYTFVYSNESSNLQQLNVAFVLANIRENFVQKFSIKFLKVMNGAAWITKWSLNFTWDNVYFFMRK